VITPSNASAQKSPQKSTLLFFAFERFKNLSPRRDFEQSRIVLARDARSRQLRFLEFFFAVLGRTTKKPRATRRARGETRTAFFELWR